MEQQGLQIFNKRYITTLFYLLEGFYPEVTSNKLLIDIKGTIDFLIDDAGVKLKPIEGETKEERIDRVIDVISDVYNNEFATMLFDIYMIPQANCRSDELELKEECLKNINEILTDNRVAIQDAMTKYTEMSRSSIARGGKKRKSYRKSKKSKKSKKTKKSKKSKESRKSKK